MQLTEAQFKRDGFALVTDLLDLNSRTELRRLTPQILIAAEHWRQQSEPLWFLQDDIPYLTPLLLQDRLIQRIQNQCGLQNKSLELLAVTLYRKIAGEPGTAWHQDARYIPVDDLAAFTLWLPLQPIDKTNGPIKFIPGSQHQCLFEQPQPADQSLRGMAHRSACTAEPMNFGDGTVHNPWTMHSSCRNHTDSPRLALIVNYITEPLQLSKEVVLKGQLHTPVINALRQTNHHTLGQHLQRTQK